ESGTVVKDLGAIQKSPRIKKPKPKSAKAKAVSLPMKRVAAPKGARPRKPITDGWIVYSGWLNTTGNPISYFKTRWAVPPAPATDHGQTIFLFNGIEPDDGAFILQPVLQWGSSDTAGDGSDWSITNWYVGLDGSALYSPLITVKT